MSGGPSYWLSTVFAPTEQLRELAVAAEAVGFTGLTMPDHAVMPVQIDSAYPGGEIPWAVDADWPDVFVSVADLAARTTTLRFATDVYVLPLRHPLVVARSLATIATMAPGRFVLGVGVGWMREESDAVGQDFTTRGRRTDEALGILRQVGGSGRVVPVGGHYDFEELFIAPAPAEPAPLWVGGESDAALRRAAHLADGWITEHPATGVESHIATLRELRAAGPRADEPFEIAVRCWTEPTDDDRVCWERLGVDHVKLQPWSWGPEPADELEAKTAALDRCRSLIA